jgi:hypothetical protein
VWAVAAGAAVDIHTSGVVSNTFRLNLPPPCDLHNHTHSWQVQLRAATTGLLSLVRHTQVEQVAHLLKSMDETVDPVAFISVLLRVSSAGLRCAPLTFLFAPRPSSNPSPLPNPSPRAPAATCSRPAACAPAPASACCSSRSLAQPLCLRHLAPLAPRARPATCWFQPLTQQPTSSLAACVCPTRCSPRLCSSSGRGSSATAAPTCRAACGQPVTSSPRAPSWCLPSWWCRSWPRGKSPWAASTLPPTRPAISPTTRTRCWCVCLLRFSPRTPPDC